MVTGNVPDKVVVSSKNIESLKRIVVKRLLSFAKMGNKCSICGLTCKKMMLYESRIHYTLVVGGKKGRYDEEEDCMNETNEDILDSIIGKMGADIDAGAQKYLTPSEAK